MPRATGIAVRRGSSGAFVAAGTTPKGATTAGAVGELATKLLTMYALAAAAAAATDARAITGGSMATGGATGAGAGAEAAAATGSASVATGSTTLSKAASGRIGTTVSCIGSVTGFGSVKAATGVLTNAMVSSIRFADTTAGIMVAKVV